MKKARPPHLWRDKVSEEEKEDRWQELMDVQSQISRKKNEALIGRIQRVMIDDGEWPSEKAKDVLKATHLK